MKTLNRLFLVSCLCILPFVFHAQWSAGPVVGTNLSLVENFTLDKDMLRPGINAGLYGEYSINDWLSVRLEPSFSQKSVTYNNATTYSGLDRIQDQLQLLYPGFPDVTDLIYDIVGLTGMAINDSVYESNHGMHTFQYVSVPFIAGFHYRNFCFEAGPYISYLFAANTANTFTQDVPLFKTIPPSNFDTIPMIPMLINSTFPAMNEPVVSTSESISGFATLDYGVVGGIRYETDHNFSISIRYTHGFAQKLTPQLPNSTTHHVFQFALTYNLFGKVIQSPKID